MKTGIRVSDAMTKSPIYVGPKESAFECVKKMVDQEVGSLIVKEDGKLLGIVTEKDFLTNLIRTKEDHSIPISKIMTKKEKMITITGDEDLYEAILTMSRENVRRLPVMSEDYILGLLTYKDILGIHPELYDLFIEKYKIKEHEEKPARQHYVEGTCPSCGNYHKLIKMRGRWSCEICKEIGTNK